MKMQFYIPLFGLLFSVATAVHSEDEHGHEKHEQSSSQEKNVKHGDADPKEEHKEGIVTLSAVQQQRAGIVIEPLLKKELFSETRAPGEVKLNGYRTAKVTTQISAQIVKRHVILGDHVKARQPLVTLSSVDMSEAQGALMVADQEWRRVKKLGLKVTSKRRYTEARVARQLAYSKVSAYGMTSQGIEFFLKSGDARKANGEFKLLASRDGTIAQEDFIEGAVIEPGHVLFVITDETSLWIEARLTPQQLTGIKQGTAARVKTISGWLNGSVSQLFHSLDENTRTLAVRLTVPNPNDRLHAGEFVDVYLQNERRDAAIAVPETAVVRSSDGDWQVFIAEHDNEFRAAEVEVFNTNNGYTRIEGLEPGTRIVTQGVFFLQSELAKSGFDIHNH